LLRKFAAVTVPLLLLSTVGWAQIPTGGDVFFGYSFSQGQIFNGASGGANMNGWEGSAEGKFLPWLGIVADLDWHYGGRNFLGCTGLGCTPKRFFVNGSRHALLFGPRVSISYGKYTPFAELLIGFAHQTHTGGGISNSDTTFSRAIGGGLDYKLVKGVAWRVQADEVHSRFFHAEQNNFRISTGIVFRF
jgi:hypothetical protein